MSEFSKAHLGPVTVHGRKFCQTVRVTENVPIRALVTSSPLSESAMRIAALFSFDPTEINRIQWHRIHVENRTGGKEIIVFFSQFFLGGQKQNLDIFTGRSYCIGNYAQ
jgi:methyl coenzyme M reductase subunit C